MTTDPILEVVGVTSGYNGAIAVRDLNLSVRPGEIVALLGPNGAGKTTALTAACGLLPAWSGHVRFLGAPLPRNVEAAARSGLVLVPDNRGVFHQLTVRDNLRLAAHGKQISRAFELFPKLRDLHGQRCGLLSGGEQQMLALAKAVLARPKVLLVDEMSMGLAPIVVQSLLPTIRALADDGVAVVLVEQHMELVLAVADRVMVLNHGEVVLEGAAAELRRDRSTIERAYFGTRLPTAEGGASPGPTLRTHEQLVSREDRS